MLDSRTRNGNAHPRHFPTDLIAKGLAEPVAKALYVSYGVQVEHSLQPEPQTNNYWI